VAAASATSVTALALVLVVAMALFSVRSPVWVRTSTRPVALMPATVREFASTRDRLLPLLAATVPKSLPVLASVASPAPVASVSAPAVAVTAPGALTWPPAVVRSVVAPPKVVTPL